MTKEEVLSKVRKLFELSNSPNENEAALAAAKARELLARYNLSIADLPTDDVNSTLAATEMSVRVGKAVRSWVKGLLIHVAEGFDCEHIIRRRHGSDTVLSFIGTPADAEVAIYTFRFLYRQLDSFVERALPRLRRENKGWSATALSLNHSTNRTVFTWGGSPLEISTSTSLLKRWASISATANAGWSACGNMAVETETVTMFPGAGPISNELIASVTTHF
jgi:hypothetical protein